MNAGNLRSDLETELTIDGCEVRCAESIAEVEARLTPSVADLLIVGSLDESASPCALLRGLRDGRLGDGRVARRASRSGIVPDGELAPLLRAFDGGADDVVSGGTRRLIGWRPARPRSERSRPWRMSSRSASVGLVRIRARRRWSMLDKCLGSIDSIVLRRL